MEDPNNLNNFNELSKLNPQERKREIQNFENRPAVKNNDFGAYDKREEEKISKVKLKYLRYAAYLSVISFVIISWTMGYSFYNNHEETGSWNLFPKMICNLTAPECPPHPACICNETTICGNLSCGNYVISPQSPDVYIILNNTNES